MLENIRSYYYVTEAILFIEAVFGILDLFEISEAAVYRGAAVDVSAEQRGQGSEVYREQGEGGGCLEGAFAGM